MKRSLKDWLLESSYVNGVGREVPSLLDIYANLCLVEEGERPSFLIQEADYQSKSMYRKIVRKIVEQGYFKVTFIEGGALVYLEENTRVAKMVGSLEEDGWQDEDIGKVLGYPAASDFPDYRSRGRKFFRWTVNMGDESAEIMTNVFTDEGLIPRMVRLASRFNDALSRFGMTVSYSTGRMR